MEYFQAENPLFRYLNLDSSVPALHLHLADGEIRANITGPKVSVHKERLPDTTPPSLIEAGVLGGYGKCQSYKVTRIFAA